MDLARLAFVALFVTIVLSQDYYSSQLAQRMIQFSNITYQEESSILAWNCDLCQKISFSQPSIVQEGSVFAVLGYSSEYNRIVVAFRGSVDIANWILNLEAIRVSYPLCNDCSVHNGFNEGYNSVKSSIEATIDSLRSKHSSAKIMVTGHSLGGALAVMAAAHLQDKYSLVEMLYTLGQPRVGNDKFAQFMTSFIPNTYRIVHYADQVTHLPQSLLGYKHSGWQIWYKQDMQSYTICPSQNKECSNQLNIFQMSASDHHIAHYLKIKVEDSLLSEASSFFLFKWLRFMTKDQIFNLDIRTMLEEDRQVKETIRRYKEQRKLHIKRNVNSE